MTIERPSPSDCSTAGWCGATSIERRSQLSMPPSYPRHAGHEIADPTVASIGSDSRSHRPFSGWTKLARTAPGGRSCLWDSAPSMADSDAHAPHAHPLGTVDRVEVFRYLDLVVLALAFPVFVVAGFPLLGYAAGAVAWLLQR